MCLYRPFIFQNFEKIEKIGKILKFFGPHTPIPAPIGVKFGVEESTYSSTPNFTPIGATCRLCGAKNLKIAPLSDLNTAVLRAGWR